MTRITVTSGPDYVDQLDGKPLADGERLRVRWPDGSESEVTVDIEVTQTVHAAARRAVARVTVRGVALRVPLNGLEAERIDVKARLLAEARERAEERRRLRLFELELEDLP